MGPEWAWGRFRWFCNVCEHIENLGIILIPSNTLRFSGREKKKTISTAIGTMKGGVSDIYVYIYNYIYIIIYIIIYIYI